MLQENILNPFFNYLFENPVVSNLLTMLFTTYFTYILMKLTIGGIKRWYKLFMIS